MVDADPVVIAVANPRRRRRRRSDPAAVRSAARAGDVALRRIAHLGDQSCRCRHRRLAGPGRAAAQGRLVQLGLSRPCLWVCMAVAAAATLLAIQMSRSQFGRRMLAVRDSELAATSVGIRIVRTKIQAFISQPSLPASQVGSMPVSRVSFRRRPSIFSVPSISSWPSSSAALDASPDRGWARLTLCSCRRSSPPRIHQPLPLLGGLVLIL